MIITQQFLKKKQGNGTSFKFVKTIKKKHDREYQSTILQNEFSKSGTVKHESKVRALAKSFNPSTNPTKSAIAPDNFHLHKTPIM